MVGALRTNARSLLHLLSHSERSLEHLNKFGKTLPAFAHLQLSALVLPATGNPRLVGNPVLENIDGAGQVSGAPAISKDPVIIETSAKLGMALCGLTREFANCDCGSIHWEAGQR